MELAEDLQAAIAIVEDAGRVALSYFGTERVGTRDKGDRDVVTEADFASERLLVKRLGAEFPGDGVVAEEGSERAAQAGRRWFLDPIDGTLNYSRAIPVWCVSAALFEGDQPILGVIHDPIRGETFSAAAGEGAWCNGVPIRSSGLEDASRAVVHLTVDFNDSSMLEGLDDLSALAARVLRTRNIGSAALAMAYVASGRFDAMLHRFANTWDFGAGALLVREAGGAITDMTDAPYSVASISVAVAATEALRAALLRAVQSGSSARVE